MFGNIEDYLDGLTKKLVGLTRSIEQECCENEAGKYWKDFEYVARQAAVELVEDLSKPHRVRDFGYGGMTIEDFLNHPNSRKANLS